MTLKTLRGVIFDLDGTVANTLPLVIAAFRQAIEPLANRSYSDAEIIATFGPSEEGTIRALVPDHYEAGLADYRRHYAGLHGGWPEPFPGVAALLSDLKRRGVRLAMVTGKGTESTAITLHRYGMESAFEFVETGDPNGPRKAACIRRVLEKWGMDPAEAVYIGDAPSDVTASREAGVAVVGAGWAETTDQALLVAEHPDVMLSSVADLADWLNAHLA